MAYERKVTAKEAVLAVLKKAQEVLQKSELMKAEPVGELHPKEKEAAPSDNVETQPAPNTNPDEVKENGNPAPGASPQNEDPYAAEIKGHLKLAKFIGRMEHKRSSKGSVSNG